MASIPAWGFSPSSVLGLLPRELGVLARPENRSVGLGARLMSWDVKWSGDMIESLSIVFNTTEVLGVSPLGALIEDNLGKFRGFGDGYTHQKFALAGGERGFPTVPK